LAMLMVSSSLCGVLTYCGVDVFIM